ncbi:MAG: hypothetical protein JWN95_385 [Frankiales bacterium]|nr:hypothetical protein [Frankiales bacterium]
MAQRRATGLDEATVATMRAQLADGKRPRVVLSGPQFGADTSGAVTRIGDPASDGPDFMTVRVTVNGSPDELAFAPSELRLRTAGRKPAASSTRKAAAPSKASQPARKVPAPKTSVPKRPVPSAMAVQLPMDANPMNARATNASPASPGPTSASPASPGPASASPAPRPVAKKSTIRRASQPPKVTVTLTSVGASWTVSALRGTRSVAKNHSVPPGVVTAIADLLDQEGVIEAVAEVNETARAEAEDRAAKLRAELDQLEAVLAAHRLPS